jgi:hypothetical protein
MGRAAADRLFALIPRPMQPRRPPRCTAHFSGALTHVQRLEAIRLIKRSGLSLRGGFTDVSGRINGLDGFGRTLLTAERRADLMRQLVDDGLTTPRVPRWQYKLGMLGCKAVVSIAGHGEICYRMSEAWAMRRVLVCQDLSHVRTLYPLEAGRNVVYCRPDLSDLVAILEDIECNVARYADIAEQGHRDWRDWSRRSVESLRQGFEPVYGSRLEAAVR